MLGSSARLVLALLATVLIGILVFIPILSFLNALRDLLEEAQRVFQIDVAPLVVLLIVVVLLLLLLLFIDLALPSYRYPSLLCCSGAPKPLQRDARIDSYVHRVHPTATTTTKQPV